MFLRPSTSPILCFRGRITFVISPGNNVDMERSIDDHFKGLFMSLLGVGPGGAGPVIDLIHELFVKYGEMLRGEDRRDEIFPYYPFENNANGMPLSTPIGDWLHGDTLKVEWIKSIVEPLDDPKGRDGK